MVRHFEWDAEKEAKNVKKHGVDFTEASTVFLDPLSQEATEWVKQEERTVMVGMSALARTLLVVYVELDGETARIISARKATKKEREDYEEGI